MAETRDRPLDLPRFDTPVNLLLVVAPFYRDIADDLVVGASATLERAGATHELVEVPGALEIPSTIALAHRQADFDGYVALGAVIRGETTHYELVCSDSSRGITLLGLQGACIGNAIVTVENRSQAETRANPDGGDKGGSAAAAALHLIALSRKWSGERRAVGFRPAPGDGADGG